jgi:hypothetical protein
VFDIWAANPDAHAVSGDFDGDGRSDIALVGGDDWTTVPVAFSRGDGTFTVTNRPIGEFAVWANAPGVKIVTGDVNGDGRTDIVLTGGPGWWTIPVAFSNGDGTFNVSNQYDPSIPGLAQVAGAQVVAGDVNGDGRADLILTGGAGWSTIPVAFSNGNGTFNVTNALVDFFPGWAQNPYARASATDVNGDGRADVILTSGADWVTVPMALSNGDGTFTVYNQLDSYIPIWSQGIGAKTLTGDLNGDHRGDIILTAGADWITIPVGFSNGNGTLTVANPIVPAFPIWAQDPSAQAVSGDFDHDGFADIALVGGNGWFTVPIAYSNGNGTFRVTNYPVY